MSKTIKIKNIEPITKSQRQINIAEDCLVIEIVDEHSKINHKVKTKINIADSIKVDYIFLLTNKAIGDIEEHRVTNVGIASQLNNYYCYLGDNNIQIHLEQRIDSKAKINDQVIFVGSEKQRISWYETYNFLYPNGFGRFNIKGLVKDESRAHYGSHIVVKPMARKVDARLDMQAIIAGDGARVIMVPGLKIAANDVKTSHSVKISNIDDDQMFYLRSRGLNQEQVRSLFVRSIFQDFVNQLPSEELKNKINNLLIKKIQ